ncbi:MAG TPA: glycosyltransferase [Roseiarcus sp.]|nr:glycosyltransferase [Roseiarcus sp.]
MPPSRSGGGSIRSSFMLVENIMDASMRFAAARIEAPLLEKNADHDWKDLMKGGASDASPLSERWSLLAADALTIGRPETAYMFADRRCRLPAPTAVDFLLRATASRLMNEASFAEADLSRAFEIDPTHDLIVSNVLRWGAAAARPIAAACFLDGEAEDPESLRLAMLALEDAAAPIAVRMHVREGMHEGWVAWRGDSALELTIRRAGMDRAFELEPDDAHPLSRRGWSAVQIAIEIESPRLEAVCFRVGDNRVYTPFPTRDWSAPQRPPRSNPGASARSRRLPGRVEVVIPVYGDYAATQACLNAVEAEGSRIAKHVTVVDDCSPDADIRTLLEDGAARGRFTLIRNKENLGFARSVNRVLQRLSECDVLLLNSDTVLPTGAIDRLAQAAHSEPGIATVTPLSNNGEFTSFPIPFASNTLPPTEEIGALDAMAREANLKTIVDLPNGVGFCLYVTRACIEAVGLLSEIYARGYYEDVDYCLRARDAGLRNVCATGVYVGHAGCRSFQSEKRRLVVGNLKILNERFPDHERECAAFVRADPLKCARAQIEERLQADGTIVLLLAPCSQGRSAALERARQLEDEGSDRHCIHCEVDDEGACLTIRSARGSAPQSLAFALADECELTRLQAYLMRQRPEAIEVLAPHALPDAALRLACALQIPIRAAFGALDWMGDRDLASLGSCSNTEHPGECLTCGQPQISTSLLHSERQSEDRRRTRALMAKVDSIVPMDRMAAAYSAANVRSRTPLHPASREKAKTGGPKLNPSRVRLGVLCPEAIPEAERQIQAIDRLFGQRRIEASVIALGRCQNEFAIMTSGRIFVTGAIEADEYERVLRQYGISRLFSPYRTRLFGLIDRLSANSGLPMAYFDWSFGALSVAAGDLALDPRICFERAALEISEWMADGGASRRPFSA